MLFCLRKVNEGFGIHFVRYIKNWRFERIVNTQSIILFAKAALISLALQRSLLFSLPLLLYR